MAKLCAFKDVPVGEFFTLMTGDTDIAVRLNTDNWIAFLGGWKREMWDRSLAREVMVLDAYDRAIIADELGRCAIRVAEYAKLRKAHLDRTVVVRLPGLTCLVAMRAMIPTMLDYCLAREMILGDQESETRKLVSGVRT